jgi:lysophospholipase L1-like esterase
VLALACTFFIGCGVGSYADAVSTPPPPALAIRYVALGDSYTIGTNVGQSDRWPDQLVESVRDSVQLELVANLGVNGYTSGDLVQRELPQLADLRPGFVSILIGVNDVVRDISLERYRANVEETFAAVLELVPRDRVVVVSVPDYTRTPRGADYGDPEQQREAIAAFNTLMQQLAADRGVAFVDISAVAEQAGTDASLVATDKLHPSREQYSAWVELIAPEVRALLAE